MVKHVWLNPSSWASSSPESQVQPPPYETRRVHNPARLWHNHGGDAGSQQKGPAAARRGGARTGRAFLCRPLCDDPREARAPISSASCANAAGRAPASRRSSALVERMAALGYVDDRAFAAARAAALGRRGYGERRVGEALRAAGIDEEDARRGARGGRARAPGRRRCASPSGGGSARSPPREADRRGARKGAGGDAARRPSARSGAAAGRPPRPGEIPDADTC